MNVKRGKMAAEAELLNDLAELSLRPLDFVYWAYPWKEAGTELATRSGPEEWQAKVLGDLQAELLAGKDYYVATGSALRSAYQAAIRSGHGIGKTAFLCWMIQWAMATRENTRGRVTANTEKQLRTVLWVELAKWHRLFIAGSLFVHSATAYQAASNGKEWRIDAVPWSEDNTQAFAGMHNFGKRLLMIFDEASTIVDEVWEVADGVCHEAETEIIWIVTGNPTQNHGRFKDCWGPQGQFWHTYKVDSREVSFANTARINEAIALYGVETDYVKKRYLGEFPDTADYQLIAESTIVEARKRPPVCYPHEALVIGVDVARFGSNESVIVFRRGKDSKSVQAIRRRGYDVVELGQEVARLISNHAPDQVFIDEGGVGGGVVDFIRHLGHSVIGVNFGSKPSGAPAGIRVANKRAEMYIELREWLRSGGQIEDSQALHDQLVAITYFHRKNTEEIVLTSKEDMIADGLASPDWADALALTFAYPVSLRGLGFGRQMECDYDPLSPGALPKDPYKGWIGDGPSA